MPPGRAAARFEATSRAPRGTLPGKPPRHRRACRSSEGARPPREAAPLVAPRRARRCRCPRSPGRGPQGERAQRANLVRTGRAAASREVLGKLDRLVERIAVDDVEPEQLLLGFGEGPID